jgi:hypothetical protein
MHAEQTHGTLAALHPVGRMGDIDDIVDAIAFLETAEFVTGEILHVDGGQSAGRPLTGRPVRGIPTGHSFQSPAWGCPG